MTELEQLRLNELMEVIEDFMHREAMKGANARWAWFPDHPKWKEMTNELRNELKHAVEE